MNQETWAEVVNVLRPYPWRTEFFVYKGLLPHPLEVGMAESIGVPDGQSKDYRYLLEDGSGLHVKEYEAGYKVHLDKVHPGVDLVEHWRQDAPEVFVVGCVVLGTIIGKMTGKSWGEAVVKGGTVGGLTGLALLP